MVIVNSFSLDTVFQTAVDIVQCMPKKGPVSIPVNQKLKLYSLFKQGTVGKCNISCPPFWNAVERLKWRAWNALGSMDCRMAKQLYVDELKNVINRIRDDYDLVYLARQVDEEMRQSMAVKLAILGYDMSNLNTEELVNVSKKESNNRDREGNGMETGLCLVSNICSDEEFVDAANCDNETHNCWRTNPFTQRNELAAGSDAQMLSVTESRSIRSQSMTRQRLSALLSFLITFIKRIIGTFLSRLSGNLRQVRNRWKVIFFVILWPFVANFTMAYLCYLRFTRW